MFFDKSLLKPKSKNVSVDVTFDGKVDNAKGKCNYTCNTVCHDGKLFGANGFQKVFDVDSYIATFGKIDDEFVFVDDTGTLYTFDGEDTTEVSSVDFSNAEIISHIQGDTKCLILTQEDGIYKYNGTLSQLRNATLSSIVVCGERLFGASGNDVVFSAPVDFSKWGQSNGGSTLTFANNVDKLVAFDGKVYAFCIDGIYKITPSATLEDIECEKVFNGKTIGKTAGATNKGIYFVGEGYLQVINGNVKKVFDELAPMLTSVKYGYGFGDGYFLVATTPEYFGKVGCETLSYQSNSIFAFDTSNGTYRHYRGIQVDAVTEIDGEVAFCFGGNAVKLGSNQHSGKKIYALCPIAFDSRAVLKSVYIASKNNVDLIVRTGDTRIYHLSNTAKLPLNISGNNFNVSLESDGEMQVDNLKLNFVVYGGGSKL